MTHRRSISIAVMAAMLALAVGVTPAVAAVEFPSGPRALQDCGYGKRGLQLTAVSAKGVSCNTAWDIISGAIRNVIANWEQGWFQDLYQSGDSRRFNYSGYKCTVRAVSHEGFRLTCTSGWKKIVSGTGA